MSRPCIIDSPNLKFDSSVDIPALAGIGDQEDPFTIEAAREFYETDFEDEELAVILGTTHSIFPETCQTPLADLPPRKF